MSNLHKLHIYNTNCTFILGFTYIYIGLMSVNKVKRSLKKFLQLKDYLLKHKYNLITV